MITQATPTSVNNMLVDEDAETLPATFPVASEAAFPLPRPGITRGHAAHHAEEEEADNSGPTRDFATTPLAAPTLDDLSFPDPGIRVPPEIDENALIDTVTAPARSAEPESDKLVPPSVPFKRPGRVTPQLEQPPVPLLEPDADLEESPLPPRAARQARSIHSETLYSSSALQRFRQYDDRRANREWIKSPRGGSSRASQARRRDSEGLLAIELEFGKLDHYRWFRNMGMILNFLSALALGILQHSWYIGALCCISLVLFWFCIRLVNVVVAGIVGVILAGYWGYVGWELAAYVQRLYPVDWFPPLLLVAIAFVLVSGYLHTNYITKRLP